jgi:ATP-dependent DNA helicase RecQ
MMDNVENVVLPKLFGHAQFKPGQHYVIGKVLSGESCLAILPTGAGKSLLYMLPSQLLDGVTLVVSPLLALMRDQVEALRQEGIEAVRLDSSMTREEILHVTQEILSGRVKVLYVTPERFNNEGFNKLIAKVKVAMFVVDEAHCISEWGHDFRPDYLRLSHFASVSNAPVRLALTATATKRVAQDILERLDISENNLIQLPSSRRNLDLKVKSFKYPFDGYQERLRVLLETLPDITKDGAAIIYVNKKAVAERLSLALNRKGFNARPYHSGIENRQEVEQWFLNKNNNQDSNQHGDKKYDGSMNDESFNRNKKNRNPIVVGTTAFGMGIDKSDIRAIVHFDMPRCVEDYVQGIGRAGRDGKNASCLAFLGQTDLPLLRSQIIGMTPQRGQILKMVREVFGGNPFPATYDNALYINFYDISRKVDIMDLPLKLAISQLVKRNMITEITPLFGSCKIGIYIYIFMY